MVAVGKKQQVGNSSMLGNGIGDDAGVIVTAV
jgi:hypothetical protein